MGRRSDPRVDRRVREAVAELLDGEIADPRVQHVTITDANVSDDHKHATVYYTRLDADVLAGGADLPDDEEVAEGLESAAPRLQGLLSRRMRLKNTPQLRFEPDAAAAEGRRIDQLLRELREESPRGEDE